MVSENVKKITRKIEELCGIELHITSNETAESYPNNVFPPTYFEFSVEQVVGTKVYNLFKGDFRPYEFIEKLEGVRTGCEAVVREQKYKKELEELEKSSKIVQTLKKY